MHKLCEAHSRRLNHDTETCCDLCDLRRDLAKGQGGQGRCGYGRGCNNYRGKGRTNATEANAIPVHNGGGSVNGTMADLKAFLLLAYKSLLPTAKTNATIDLCHSICTTNTQTLLTNPTVS
jgi:hypothetical protein